MMGHKRLLTWIDEGTAKIEGDKQVLEKLAAALVHFTPDFEMVLGTRNPAPRKDDLNPYELVPSRCAASRGPNSA